MYSYYSINQVTLELLTAFLAKINYEIWCIYNLVENFQIKDSSI